MKLALSCNGEGFGHASRAVVFAQALKHYVELVLYAPDTVLPFLSKKLPWVEIRSIPAFLLEKEGDRISYSLTAKKNIPLFFRMHKEIAKLADDLNSQGVGAVLSDFEPFSGWAAASAGIPVLQVNHPGIIIKSPSFKPEAMLAKIIASFMMGHYDSRIFVSFFDGDCGPLIRPDLKALEVRNEGHIILNLKPSYRPPVFRVLEKLKISNYLLFPDPYAKNSYEQSLASCMAVISSAGHQTICEAAYFNKPVLAIPQRGQYEQKLNARFLEASGRGMSSTMKQLPEKLPCFLERFSTIAAPIQSSKRFDFQDDTGPLIERIMRFVVKAAGRRIIPLLNTMSGDTQAYVKKQSGKR